MADIYREGSLRADKVQYKDGIGCCIWYPIEEKEKSEMEDCGICFDFAYEDIDDLIKLLKKLKKVKAEKYKEPVYGKGATPDEKG